MGEYWSRYKGHFFLIGLFTLLIHSSKLNSVIVGIDTENIIQRPDELYAGWLNTGRQGLVLLKYLTGSACFNPFLAGGMTLAFLAVGVSAFLLLWDRVSGQDSRWIWAGAAFLWIAHPVLVEQFYFSLQSAEICAGIMAAALALWLLYGEDKRVWHYGLSWLLLLLAFSVYQIFVVLFIFGTVSVLLLETLQDKGRQDGALGVLRQTAPYAGVFFGAFLCNSLITGLFFGKSDYLSSQIRWGKDSPRDCIYNIAIHVRNVLTGQDSIFYSGIFGLLFLSGLVMVFFLIRRYGLRLLFYYLSLMITPFLMTAVCGNAPAVRSQLVLPILTGFLFYLDGELGKRCCLMFGEETAGKLQKTVLTGLALLCLVGGVLEAQISLRLYYTDACRYAQDEAVARALIQELEPLIGEDDTPVVVLGSRSFQGNNACVRGEIIGHSVFEHDVDVEPRFYWSTRRVLGFFHTLGYDCEQLSDKNIPYAMDFAEEMGVWPGKQSVEHAGDMVIIKLSEF